ncbi:MAG TPA: thrombospondin type 3 repeat-containing protein, partial [Candidatus Polarisedimenticolia bacterium]|nr:thrombospondin type 3 repeat-containing protein [Candidatus Polarisedimenticolia bacterium]
TVPTPSGGLAIAAAQLRLALAWIDLPSPENSGGPLINDLDLRLESPGPDSCLAAGDTRPDGAVCPAGSASDNVYYDGNDYASVNDDPALSQWSRPRAASPEVHDTRNPVEAIHLTADPDNDRSFADSAIYAGRWRVTVKRGLGGATPGSITIVTGPDPDEDDNNNGRLDAGEDENGNGLLDLPGQAYALIVSGPVFAAEPPPAAGPQTFPASRLSLDRTAYDCGAGAVASILDTTPAASPALSSSATTFTVLGANGSVLDTETGILFSAAGSPGATTSAAVPVRLAGPALGGNGILEADTGQRIRVRYAPAGQTAVEASAVVRCSPDLIRASFSTQGGRSIGDQVSIQGGCDGDAFPDAGEVVSYGVALQNRSREAQFADVVATLTPSGPGAGAVRVLDSPRALGLLPDGGSNAAFFQVYVDPAVVQALPVASRVVTMRLDLDSSERGVRLGRQTYTFTHALNADRDERRYSTDAITGAREVRDLNRNGVIDRAGETDPALGFVLPAEDATFSSLFSGSGAPAGHFTNELGEDLNLSGSLEFAERDFIPNAAVDRGILNSNNPADPAHRAPWSFDSNNGGWLSLRHSGSKVGLGIGPLPIWEYKTNGRCGFQTAGGLNKFGVWHTGDTNAATPTASSPCDNHPSPSDPSTPNTTEYLFDIAVSPLLAKVNQSADARGFPWTVEFQRVGLNLNIQLFDGYAGGGVNVDNDVESDGANSLLAQRSDPYYASNSGGWPVGLFRFAYDYFPGDGIDPQSLQPQRTFGPFTNPDGSATLNGDETGFTGYTTNTNPYSTSPIPEAPPDFLPFPRPGQALAGVCTGGGAAGSPCAPGVPGDPCVVQGGACAPQTDTVAGPVRNFDATLLGYEGGFASLNNGLDAVENIVTALPGRAGNRWQIGIGFWAVESASAFTDYGVAFDDVVFEWNEWHPEDESVLGVPPACSRFGGTGQPAGGACATVTADRTALYECDESIEVTVHDAKCLAIGSGATAALGGACVADADCGAGGICTAARPSVEVAVVTDSDANAVVVDGQAVLFPTSKRFALPAVAGTPGLYKGRVAVTTVENDAAHLYVDPANDRRFAVYYFDPLCDGDRDGQAGEDGFDNADGDGIPDASDKCPLVHDPGQADADGDGRGDLCDNCPNAANANQADADADGAGDACEFDDLDGDLVPNLNDNCPDVRNLNQSDIDANGRGDLCDTLKTSGITFGGSTGMADCVAGTCARPGDAVGDACVTDEDCIRGCHNNLCTQGNSGTAGGLSCLSGPNTGQACTSNTNCSVCVGGTTPGVACITNSCVSACVGGTNPGAGCANDRDCAGGGTCSNIGTCVVGLCFINFVAPTPTIGQACVTHADCYADLDRDADGVIDALDNCVIAANGPLGGPSNQIDSDLDGLGDACDADCGGAAVAFRCRANGAPCPAPETNQPAACANPYGLGPVCGFYVTNAGGCSTRDDDLDADGVGDAFDDCPATANAAVFAGGPQRDRDRDGLGDACDPPAAYDDTADGLPDDVVTFQGAIACHARPLASLTLVGIPAYVDFDGDHDQFPDTGERGRVSITVRNDGPALDDAVLTLVSTDPDVACITEAQVVVPSLPAGVTMTIGSLDPGQPGFGFVASNALQSQPPPVPVSRIDLQIQVAAPGILGNAAPIAVSLFADYNMPPGSQQFVLGPDGLAGTADDGTVIESFDSDRDEDGNVTVRDTFLEAVAPGVFRGSCSNAPLTACVTAADCPASPPGAVCQSGAYLRGIAGGSGLNRVAAVVCGGFDAYSFGPCVLDPDFPMDWHLHCAPGAANCPNVESGTCVGGCSFNTPTGGQRALSPPNSLHMGAHFVPGDALAGDTTHLRALQGFMTAPLNLAFLPRPGDLDLSFFHIARLMDNNGVGPNNEHQCVDCADVQIQVDQNPDPNVDAWGFWDKMAPYQNVYDHKPVAWSTFGSYYCVFTPADAGAAPPNPRGVHETICYPQGAWSHCGSTIGTTPAATVDCAGPGVVDPSGTGVWVQTRFRLDSYLGQRIRIRWIAETWAFDETSSAYYPLGGIWAATMEDDGWWLDDIQVTGVLTRQLTPAIDTTPRTGACPGDPCDAAAGDAGTSAVLEVADAAGAPIDGVTRIPTTGERIRLGAAASTFPGGCVDGHAEYRFLRDGAVVQDWSANPFFTDSPERTTR